MYSFFYSLVQILNIANYDNFILDFNKTYSESAKQIYINNSNFIDTFQSDSFNVSMNHMGDLVMSSMNNFVISDDCHNCLDDLQDEIIPISVDWRNKGAVTHVKNQEKCGGCWAFSATGAIEGSLYIHQHHLYNLSEQQFLDCSDDYGNNGCNGGLMDNAFKFAINNNLCNESSYPYIGYDQKCYDCISNLSIKDYQDVTPNDEKALKRAVSKQPVSVAIQANKQSFQFYSKGIYDDMNCGFNLDHGVLIVGYGFDIFTQTDYWIVKNSWGDKWGENGYIRIKRNIDDDRGLCGIAMQPSFPIV